VIDSEGFRPNVGIIILSSRSKLLWAKRIGQNAWQFPQGGINDNESIEETLYRELYEETGLNKSDVSILGYTSDWLHYRLPKRMLRHGSHPLCIGQKQKWFLLELLSEDSAINLNQSVKPEFDRWSWVSYWYPLDQIVSFKREVYRKALKELLPFTNK